MVSCVLYNPPPCRQARQGVFESFFWWSDVWMCVFLKGPQLVTRLACTPIFEHFLLVSFFDAFLEPNGPPQGPQNRSKSSKIVFQKAPWEHPPKSHQKWCNLGTLPTSKYKVSYSRGIKHQEIAGHQKCPQNDLRMPPIWDALGTQNHKKSRKLGTQKH